MTQANPTLGASLSGLAYRQFDNDGKKALLNHHKGSSAPSYAETGVIWLDDATTPWVLKIYDGSDWIAIGTINAATNAFIPYNGTQAINVINFSEASIASAATTDLGSLAGNTALITGTTTITSLGSSASATRPIFFVRFGGALTLTHNATSLILPTSANIITAAGDTAIFEYLGSGNWRCLMYHRLDGTPLGLNKATQAEAEAGTDNIDYMTSLRVAQAIAALGGVGAVDIISSASASSSASLDFTTGFGAEYDKIVFVITGLEPVTDGAALWMRTSSNGGSSYDAAASNYEYLKDSKILTSTTPTANDTSSTGDTKIILTAAISTTGNTAGRVGCFGTVILYDPADGGIRHKCVHAEMVYFENTSNDGFLAMMKITAARKSTAVVNAVRFQMDSGNIQNATITMLGVRNS